MNAPGKTGDDDQHGIAEDVTVENLTLVEPLGAGGRDILLLISSMKEFLVSSVVVANADINSVISGRVMCQK